MRLTDCFSELVAYVTYFLRTADRKQPPFDQVKADIHRLLTESDKGIKGEVFSQEAYDQARFAICSWVDEGILSSSWEGKCLWQKEPLQRLYYNTTDAGEEFYERLNTLGPHQRDVREAYYLCLAMGFTGRYCQEGDEYLLGQLKSSNLKLLTGSSVGIPSLERTELFPEAYPPESENSGFPEQRFQLSPSTLIFLAGPVALFGVLSWLYRFILSNIGEGFLTMVP
jgi:type VI secretion system protein ImpK